MEEKEFKIFEEGKCYCPKSGRVGDKCTRCNGWLPELNKTKVKKE